MFAPPLAPDQAANDDQEIGVERSTRAIRIANQFRNAPAPLPAPRATGPRPSLAAPSSTVAAPHRPIGTIVLIVALIAVVAIAAAVVLMHH